MKKIFLLTVLISALSFTSKSQVILPESTSNPVKLTEFRESYTEVKAESDSAYYQAKKRVDRWTQEVLPRLQVTNDSTYSYRAYREAFKSMLEGGFICSDDDLSNWENIGPRYVDHQNGWVSAAYVDPSDPNIILIGARVAGIFKTTNGGLNWICVTDNMEAPVLGVKQIVASPFDANYLIAITGTESGLDAVQNGYLISEDGGNTWSVGPATNIPDQLQWVHFRNEPGMQGKIYAVSDEHLWYSSDNGQSWFEMSLPIDRPQNNGVILYFQLDKVIVNESRIFITSNSVYNFTGIWRGAVDDFSVIWEPNLAPNLTASQAPFIAPGIDNTNGVFTYTALGYPPTIDPILDHHIGTGFGCNYGTYNPPNDASYTGCWIAIQTDGWDQVNIGGIDKYVCVNSMTHSREVVSFRIHKDANIIQDALNRRIEFKAHLPKGVKLKICYSNYKWQTFSAGSYNPSGAPWSMCEIGHYDYDALFQNVIYEHPFAIADEEIDVYQGFSLDPNQPFDISTIAFAYFILEFNNDYQGGQFRIDYFDINLANDPGKFIELSNVVDDRFMLHVKGASTSAFYRTIDGGINFELMSIESPIENGGRHKQELVYSTIENDRFYVADLYEPRYYDYSSGILGSNINSTQINPGHHDDYRSSSIISGDFILFGNDGGVAKMVYNSGNVGQLQSINGDLSINMIYNLDINEKTKDLVIGLQDNGSKRINASTNGWSNLAGGDGCVALQRSDLATLAVVGDPQNNGVGALNDVPIYNVAGGIVHDMIDILDGEAFLGMRLRKLRSNESRFIVGLQAVTGFPTGKVIINTGPNTFEKVPIEESVKIGAVDICQRNPNVMYAADARFKSDNESQAKLFRTTTGGLTTASWDAIDPLITIYPGGGNQETKNLSEYLQWDYIAALAVDPIQSNLVYIGMSGVMALPDPNTSDPVVTNELLRVMKSIDHGNTFVDWSQGLPALPINQLLAVESGNHLVFCAIDGGVYYRMDGMNRWECFSNNLAKTRITDLVFDYCSKELYASTYGRGVWKTPVKINIEGAYEEQILANTTWNTPRRLQSDLVVKSGKTLFITNTTIEIDADRKIIVEPGAKLIINGSTLTSSCGAFWKGIEVWGNTNQPQYVANQGYLYIWNNSVIENAKNAVVVWKPNDWNSTGGIVRAYQTTFRNNYYDIEYFDYDWSNGGVAQANLGYFWRCNFETNNSLFTDEVGDHVRLYKVNGIRFLGCDFFDSRIVPLARRGRGIFSVDARYKVLGIQTNSPAVADAYYNDQNYDVCNFINLAEGVHAMNANSQSSILVDQTNFLDCHFGVRLSSVDNAMITRNRFYRRATADWIPVHYGVYTNKSTAFQVEGNIFSKDAHLSDLSIGAWIGSAGIEDNEVRKNKMTNTDAAVYSYLRNKNDAALNSPLLEGLEFLCNEYSYGLVYDEFAYGPGEGHGMKRKQGMNSLPAGNQFTNPIGNFSSNVRSTQSTSLWYYHGLNLSETPNMVSANVLPISTTANSDCSSSFGVVTPGPGPVIDGVNKAQVEQAFYDFKSILTTKLQEYESLMSNGDRPQLHQLVESLTPANKGTVRQVLLTESPYLSEELLRELALNSPGVFPPNWLTEVVIANIEVAQNEEFMEFLQTKPFPLPASFADQIDVALTSQTERGERAEEIIYYNREKNRMANLMLKSLLHDSLGVNIPEYDFWIHQRGDFMCEVQMADLKIADGDKPACETKLDNVDNIVSQLTLGELRTELEDYSSFKRKMLEFSNSRGTIEGLNPATEAVTRGFAENATGFAQVQAQNLLCFFLGECEEPAPLHFVSLAMMQIFNPDNDEVVWFEEGTEGFSLYPNPASQEVNIHLDFDVDVMNVRVLDINGKELKYSEGKTRDIVIDVSDLNSGMYVVIISEEDEIKGIAKLSVE